MTISSGDYQAEQEKREAHLDRWGFSKPYSSGGMFVAYALCWCKYCGATVMIIAVAEGEAAPIDLHVNNCPNVSPGVRAHRAKQELMTLTKTEDTDGTEGQEHH